MNHPSKKVIVWIQVLNLFQYQKIYSNNHNQLYLFKKLWILTKMSSGYKCDFSEPEPRCPELEPLCPESETREHEQEQIQEVVYVIIDPIEVVQLIELVE